MNWSFENKENKDLDFVYKKINYSKDIKIPEEGEGQFFFSEKRVSYIDIISILINKGSFETLYITTWVFNFNSLEKLLDLYDSGKIKKVNLVIGKIDKTYRQNEVLVLQEEFEKRKGCNFVSIRNHSKVALLEGRTHNIVINGSGNMSDNTLIEQYLILNNQKLLNNIKEWFLNKLQLNNNL